MSFNILKLKKGKEKSISRYHPWIFSGAFAHISSELNEGEIVEVQDTKGEFCALGFFHHGSITVKVLSFKPIDDVALYIGDQICKAANYREAYLKIVPNTNCYRLVFGEGDLLPGLVIDRYADTAVIQIHHQGWVDYLSLICETLMRINGIKSIYHKPTEKVSLQTEQVGYLNGQKSFDTIEEYGHKFLVDWEGGQKTGFFLDQRENRRKLGLWSKGKSVLNTFSYSGGFSIYALKAGAKKAVSVDISESAVSLANQNAKLNALEDGHSGVASDVFEYLKNNAEDFDIIVLDPPAFCKNRRAVHNAIQAYKRLNLLALKNIKSGGMIFTFSCSQHINPKLFEDTIRAAAIEAKRNIQIVDKLGQPSDHPINVYFPEGEYLKGLILRVG